MKRPNRKTLILNADEIPLHIRSWQTAIKMLLKGKARQVDFYTDDQIRDGHGRMYAVPAVIQLNKYIRKDYKRAPLSKVAVLSRDRFTCQYCLKSLGRNALTIDHVIPKARWNGTGSPTRWDNLTTACYKCNKRKGNFLCKEIEMYPHTKPYIPSYDQVFFGVCLHGHIEDEWRRWLAVFPSFAEEFYNEINS